MKRITLPSQVEIKPIEWQPYVGETVNTNLIIRGGKKIQETAYYEDQVKAVPKGNAYIIGNGPSRKGFDLTQLKETGQTYGCNALYRDFIPDFIFSVDRFMSQELVDNKVYEKCVCYAPALEVNRSKKKLKLIPNNPYWISGSEAFWTACMHGHKNIYLIGFDFRQYGKNQFNNIYQDTENYGPRHDDNIFEAWLKQFRDIIKMRPYCNFTVVHDTPPEYLQFLQTGTDLKNSKIITYKEFTDTVLNRVT